MVQEAAEIKAGVCPLIINSTNPNLYLGVQERTWKRETNKLAGMWSPAFETVEPGESHLATLKRCIGAGCGEEISIVGGEITIPDNLDNSLLCKVQLSSGIWLYVYPLVASNDLEVVTGLYTHEVQTPAWISDSLVVASKYRPGNFTFRPGVLEISESLREQKANRWTYRPRIYENPVNSVPTEVFDLLEAGISQNEALYRLGLGPQQLLKPDPSGRLLS
ncbi:hypothetical protein A3B45_00725 [Candidatus Daviesbacteria bacterium RIFCSPLOWO2_01_FULL_39_12]|uniref:Nudix hydrolase domain-containing protein n=1 Tax=Candidatus Daviesbacteria bacterium RIFCSPLOWO2_01_FULL_39_12 TaxID=1797785 RepID=A0A1F5KQR2_9BACT|nr:MAG: hypothetical protein A3B45_00725 [Candidatus Daviesbacteria bacterium RIFCSPLOWO2_01_FULL_39_12]